MELANSHDKFFKEIFSNKENAVDILRGTLPKNITKNINFTTLTTDNTSYIDEELQEVFSDLVFNVQYRSDTKIKIAILIEHKSFIPKYPHIQILKYILKIWESNIKQKEDLVPVLPVLFYAGKEKWTHRSFNEYFKGIDESLLFYQPVFEYMLMDISHRSDLEIAGMYEMFDVRIALLTMKKIFENIQDFSNFALIFSGLDDMELTERRQNFLASILRYIISNVDIDHKIIIEEITKISTKGGEIAMTTATRLIQQGKQEGMQEGMQEAIINLYSSGRFTIEEIAKFLKLNLRFVKEVVSSMQN